MDIINYRTPSLESIYNKIVYVFYGLFYFIYSLFSKIEFPSLSLIHIYIIITFIILGIFAYIKLKYPFWSNQPCWHTYDYWRYLYKNPFIIQKSKPVKTKFLNLKNVETVPYLEATEETIIQCINLLQCFYIPTDKILLTINKTDMTTLMKGHDEIPFLSIYYENQYITDSSNIIMTIQKPIACMISYPVHIYYLETITAIQYSNLYANYWDYICIHRNHKEKPFLRNLIQTHEYNQRIKSPHIPVSLFKKEISLCSGIVPLLEYKSYTYHLEPIKIPKLPFEFIIVRIIRENISILFDFFEKLKDPQIPNIFAFYAYTSNVNLTALIESNQLYVYCLKKGEHVYGMYFIKKTYTIYEDIQNGNTLQLVASINNSSQPGLFANGFVHSMTDLLKTSVEKYHVLVIDECSHNKILLQEWNKTFSPMLENQCAYYLYNFVYPSSPLPSDNAFILL